MEKAISFCGFTTFYFVFYDLFTQSWFLTISNGYFHGFCLFCYAFSFTHFEYTTYYTWCQLDFLDIVIILVMWYDYFIQNSKYFYFLQFDVFAKLLFWFVYFPHSFWKVTFFEMTVILLQWQLYCSDNVMQHITYL